MICETCKDEGVVQIRPDAVTRCPSCNGTSWMRSLHEEYEQRQRRRLLAFFIAIFVLVVVVGFLL